MKYCHNCGKELPPASNYCPSCGAPQNDGSGFGAPPAFEVDAPNFMLTLLGFFVPLAGLILYLYWHDKMPLKARSAGRGALISFIINAILCVAVFALIVIFGATAFSSNDVLYVVKELIF